MPALKRVGHKGADRLVPGNTPASFDAAVRAGVEMIEFDVLSERPDGTGELYLAHDYEALGVGDCPTLAEGLDHLAGEDFAGIELDVDLKLPGYETRVLDALAERRLLERSLLSSTHRASLAAVRRSGEPVRVGWSVPRVRRDYTTDVLTRVPALAAATGLRGLLPRLTAGALRRGECDAIMCHWRLVGRALVRSVHAAGGELYVWTVDDPVRLGRLRGLGVDAIITNDPRLFDLTESRKSPR